MPLLLSQPPGLAATRLASPFQEYELIQVVGGREARGRTRSEDSAEEDASVRAGCLS
jgi:hypothetical protein